MSEICRSKFRDSGSCGSALSAILISSKSIIAGAVGAAAAADTLLSVEAATATSCRAIRVNAKPPVALLAMAP